ncbi:hypothetical protein ACWCQL_15200 [Streptomyces sp. NPDC002073]|uniref:hypothetical protein n=1 Tax=Streptomyces sp. NBC_00239 TaxID=2903640 RepID=UPI002E2C4313|nr:hypothetical protein [Streptomyces sp. NBC_00239]
MWRWGRRRRTCAALANGLEIPQPFDLGAFCDLIAEQRGRPLVLLPLEGPGSEDLPCGVWLGLDTADLVFYDATAPDILRVHIVLHEIAHMLLGHVAPELDLSEDPTKEELDTAAAHFGRLLARADGAIDGADRPDLPIAGIVRAESARIRAAAAAARPSDAELGLSADRIVHLLGRTKYSSREEQEAETVATLILERASRRSEIEATSDDAAEVLNRLNDTFGHPVRNE